MLAEHARSYDPVFTKSALASTVHAHAQQLFDVGRHVDKRLLDPNGADHLVSRYLTFAQRRGIVRHEGPDRWRVALPMQPLDVPPAGIGYPTAQLAYAANELAEMLSAF